MSHLRTLLALIVMIVLSSPVYAEVIQTDNAKLKALIEQGATIVDVRTTGEWRQTGIIEGSHQIMFFNEQGQYDVEAWLTEFSKVAGPDEPVVLICATGGRTMPITNFLAQQMGYKQVHNVTKGIRAWISEGNTTVPPNECVADCGN